MRNLELLRSETCSSADEFSSSVRAVAGPVEVQPRRRTDFFSETQSARLSRIGFLNLDLSAMRVRIPEAHGFFGLTVALHRPFRIMDGRRVRTFDSRSAHLLYPDRDFDFRIEERGSVLGTNFFVDDFEVHARRLGGDVTVAGWPRDGRISLTTPAGAGLLRYLMFVWGELGRGGGVLNSGLVASEIEDGLIAAFVAAMDTRQAEGRREPAGCDDRRLARTEEYLLAHLREPVSRAALAEVAGVSIRTLSRGFQKRHGAGPMAFLRQRRLEAAYADLLAAEPGSTTVAEISGRYGFAEPGKFSTAYKARFLETPSETLRR